MKSIDTQYENENYEILGEVGEISSAHFEHSANKIKHRKRRKASIRYRSRLKHLSDISYPIAAIPVGTDGRWNFDDPVGTVYYKRVYRANRSRNRYACYKKYSNRLVRQYSGELHKGSSYRKIFEYWRTVD